MGSLWRFASPRGVGEVVGELVAPLAGPWLAELLLHLPRCVVALFSGGRCPYRPWACTRCNQSPVLDNLLLLPAGLVLNVDTLEGILGGDGQVVHGVAHPVFDLGAVPSTVPPSCNG